MTYNVSSGTLNPTIPYYRILLHSEKLISKHMHQWSWHIVSPDSGLNPVHAGHSSVTVHILPIDLLIWRPKLALVFMCVGEGNIFSGCPFAACVCSFVWTDLVTTIFYQQFEQLDETYREYSQALSDGLIRFWRSKVKVTAGRQGGKGIHVNSGASEVPSSFCLRFVVVYFVTDACLLLLC